LTPGGPSKLGINKPRLYKGITPWLEE